MRHSRSFCFLATLLVVGLLATPVLTQNVAEKRAAALRQQLADLEVKQTELETRLQQLEEDLDPKNIEKALAGVGSTRPEELRDQRRRKLDIAKKSVQTQLEQLATNRTRLEKGIAQAQAAVYHSSAVPNTEGPDKEPASSGAEPASVAPAPAAKRSRRGYRKKPRPRRTPRGN